jgi:anti-sigma regulatory factor (Ser/Thr protein kinase)
MVDQDDPEEWKVDLLLDSTLDSVDIAEEAVLKKAQEIGFGEDNLHDIGMAVRECMVNAVVHGNRYNARKKVHVMIQRSADRLAIVIQDEGGRPGNSGACSQIYLQTLKGTLRGLIVCSSENRDIQDCNSRSWKGRTTSIPFASALAIAR